MLNRRVLTVLAMTAAAAGSLSFASAASAAPAMGTVRGAGEDGALKDHYIVVLKDGSTTTSDALAGKVGGSVSTRYNSTVKGFSGEMSSTAARRLAADPAVKYVEQDRVVRIEATTQTSATWGLDRIDQHGAAAERDLHVRRPAQQRHRVHHRHRHPGDPHGVRRARARSGYDFVDNDADATDCHGPRHARRRHGRWRHLRRGQGRQAGRGPGAGLPGQRLLLADHRRRRLGDQERGQARRGQHEPGRLGRLRPRRGRQEVDRVRRHVRGRRWQRLRQRLHQVPGPPARGDHRRRDGQQGRRAPASPTSAPAWTSSPPA